VNRGIMPVHQNDGTNWVANLGLKQGAQLLCLVDGEHYPTVIAWAVETLENAGYKVPGLIFLGGTEKVENAREELQSASRNLKLYVPEAEDSLYNIIEQAISAHHPDAVIDLSDEPIVDSPKRFHLISRCLRDGVQYIGSDFHFRPNSEEQILTKTGLAIVGSGKRVGKTAVSVSVARYLREAGYEPTIVSMGRGGPPEPDVLLPVEIERTPDYLLSVAEKGMHAASDYWEDAILADVPTIGCRRCGGGMAGTPFISNVREGAEIANEMPGDVVLMEGSGPTFPPVATDYKILVVGAGQPLDSVTGYLNKYRLLVADLVIITMCEKPIATPEKVERLVSAIKEVNQELDIITTVFRPEPLGEIQGMRVVVASTSPHAGIGVTPHLSDRKKLRDDLKTMLPSADILLTEIKAASIDVAARMAQQQEKSIVFLHNQIVSTNGSISDLRNRIVKAYTSSAMEGTV